MSFLNYRHELTSKAASKVASAGGPRLQNSAFANTFLAPIVANRYPFIITPYLGLRARLSQVWINRWTILLLLVLVRTLIAIANLHDDIDSARRESLSACSNVETAGSAMASMPHYMSQGVNALAADGVEKAIDGLMSMLLLTVTGVEEIVLFVINMLTSTYVCLITLVVRGALHAAIDLIENVSDFLNTALGDISKGIHTTVEEFQAAYNDFVNGLNDVGSLIGVGDSIPKLDISADMDKLNNLHLPSGLDADLQQLSKNIPTFSQVQDFTNNAIRWPFEEVKKLINDSLPNYKFNRNVFPVPQKEQLTFCSDNNGINNFFDGLVDLGILARKITIAVLVILAVLVCGPMAWLEIRRHRKLQERAALVRDASTAPMDAVYIASRPFTASAGLKAASAFKATRRQHLVRWAVAYATTVPALFVLSLGLAGLFSCLCRYIILQAVQHEVPDLTNEVAAFASKVVTSLDHASEAWANGTNTAILDLNGKINNDVFGWVNSSTHAVNHTLNVFVDESISALHDAFGGTVLFGPVKELFNCLIGLKVAGIERGLTWVHQHAHIDFPLLPNNTFSLGAAASLSGDANASSFLSSPGSGATDAITAIVDALAAKIARSIRTEAIISSCVVAIWVVIALAGVLRALWLFYGSGHMPADAAGLAAPRDNDGGGGNGEKSPSFVGDTYHTPTLPHLAAAPPREKPPAYANGAIPSHPANQYNGASYTLAPRPFPQFDNPPAGAGAGLAVSGGGGGGGKSAAQPPRLSPVPEHVGYAGERRDVQMKRREDVRRSEYGAVGGRAVGGVTFEGMGH